MTNEDWIVFGALVGSALLVAISGIAGGVRSPKDIVRQMGPANFDFTKSFASTITTVGAVLTTLLAAKNLITSPKPHLDQPTYAALSLFFALLVVLAPFTYRAMSVTKPVRTAQGADIQSQGYAGGFLLATWLTLWAVLGEVIVIFFFLTDLQGSAGLGGLLLALFGGSGLLLLVYVWVSVRAVLVIQADRAAHKARLQFQITALNQQATEAEVAQAPLPSWQVL